jgi:hypothetical protein
MKSSETTPDEFGLRTRYTLVEVQEHHKSKILETTQLEIMNLEKNKEDTYSKSWSSNMINQRNQGFQGLLPSPASLPKFQRPSLCFSLTSLTIL